LKIDAGTRISSHVVINGPTVIWQKQSEFFQFSSLGEVPAEKKYKGEPTFTRDW